MLDALRAIDVWHRRFDRRTALTQDPLRFVHRYTDRRDREVVAVLSALMAFGRVAIISAKLQTLFSLLAPSPGALAETLSREDLHRKLEGFRHRTFRGDDIADLTFAMGVLLRRDGSVFTSLEKAFSDTQDLRTALARWTVELRTLAWPDGLDRASRHLVPDPNGSGASKRLLLLLRWVARPDDGIDLGLSSLPTHALVIPLDVHVHRIARNLGLTRRNDASWTTAMEVTEHLRTLSPEDPAQFDMAICHLGISLRCPSRKDPARCEGCALQPVCIHWRPKARKTA